MTQRAVPPCVATTNSWSVFPASASVIAARAREATSLERRRNHKQHVREVLWSSLNLTLII